jgi:hypothetical protein
MAPLAPHRAVRLSGIRNNQDDALLRAGLDGLEVSVAGVEVGSPLTVSNLVLYLQNMPSDYELPGRKLD